MLRIVQRGSTQARDRHVHSAGTRAALGAVVCVRAVRDAVVLPLLFCSAGQYSASNSSACTVCPAGKYNSNPGLATCTVCKLLRTCVVFGGAVRDACCGGPVFLPWLCTTQAPLVSSRRATPPRAQTAPLVRTFQCLSQWSVKCCHRPDFHQREVPVLPPMAEQVLTACRRPLIARSVPSDRMRTAAGFRAARGAPLVNTTC